MFGLHASSNSKNASSSFVLSRSVAALDKSLDRVNQFVYFTFSTSGVSKNA